MAKTFAGTYLYNKYGEYEKKIFNFIMNGTELDKDIPEFGDIVFEVKKRKITNNLIKVLMSKDVVLMINDVPLDKAFKVFCAKDVKGPDKSRIKIFIDCSGVIKKSEESGRYFCDSNKIDYLISYLVSAMHTMIYYMDESRLINNAKIMQHGAECFSALFTYIVDYICKISTMPDLRAKTLYLSSLYFVENIMGRDSDTDSAKAVARKISGLSSRETDILDLQLDSSTFVNIKFFVQKLSEVLRISKLSLDLIIEKWMFIYGTGTIFSLELFPAFTSMMTDVYVGAYINNQKTIEKIAGKHMVDYSKLVLGIGADAV